MYILFSLYFNLIFFHLTKKHHVYPMFQNSFQSSVILLQTQPDQTIKNKPIFESIQIEQAAGTSLRSIFLRFKKVFSHSWWEVFSRQTKGWFMASRHEPEPSKKVSLLTHFMTSKIRTTALVIIMAGDMCQDEWIVTSLAKSILKAC